MGCCLSHVTEGELEAVPGVSGEVLPNLFGAAKTETKQEQKAGGAQLDEWARATLAAHNEFRKKHGAPPLEWSDECFRHAKKHVADMQDKNCMYHGNMDGASGKHGQNCFSGSGREWGAMDAIKAWYDEVHKPGYHFAKPGFKTGTGHFTAVVWKETRYVGMAKSADGRFIAANYFPAGNMQGQFDKNVFKEGTPLQQRSPEPRLGTFTATAWSEDVMLALASCPFDHLEGKVREAFAQGHTVIIEREKTKIKVTVKKRDGSSNSTGGTWG